jgi:hypothetical protein
VDVIPESLGWVRVLEVGIQRDTIDYISEMNIAVIDIPAVVRGGLGAGIAIAPPVSNLLPSIVIAGKPIRNVAIVDITPRITIIRIPDATTVKTMIISVITILIILQHHPTATPSRILVTNDIIIVVVVSIRRQFSRRSAGRE